MPNRIMTTISKDGNATEHYEKSVVAEHISTRGEQVSVVMWLAPWPPVRETRHIVRKAGKKFRKSCES